jgi:hypothetical protein
MIIETKYNLGQELYFLSKHTGKVECSPVYKIEASAGEILSNDTKDAKTIVRCFFYLDGKHVEIVNEDQCYLTKQKLLEAL